MQTPYLYRVLSDGDLRKKREPNMANFVDFKRFYGHKLDMSADI